jgi:hypothetical protein
MADAPRAAAERAHAPQALRTARHSVSSAPWCAASVAALALGCAPDFRGAARLLASDLPPPREELFERRRTYFDTRATQLSRERGVLILADGSTLAHGLDRAWWPSGALHFERQFERGEPRGRWRSWYESGALEFEAEHAPGRITSMSWWRPDGALSSAGPHLLGLREGEWSYFHPSGVLAACGVWRAGERCGAWSFFDDAGRLLECGEYLAGERSGAWEVYERAVAPPDDPLDERQ